MSSNPNVLGYYLYSLVVIGAFIYNCRNWEFIRVTLLYYIFLTFFAYLLIYGSAYNLESHLNQLHKDGLFTAFPFTIGGDRPDVNTVLKTSPNFFPWTLTSISFFVTFPQAVTRGARIHKRKSPEKVMEKVLDHYNQIRDILRNITNIVLPIINDIYIVGEWVFVLVTISSLVSPFPMHSWYLMLLGCFFILLITGTDITIGIKGPIGIVLSAFVPGIIYKLQRLSTVVLTVMILLVSLSIAIFSAILIFSLIEVIFHTKNPGIITIIIIFALEIGVLSLSFTYLSKIITFVIDKLINWMGYRSHQ